ncbi:T9SS type A sorting domain-containing protein [Taibaiella koreensis]|uniref:T9SS type A sorting domain-containing protein n=1 Tax=Taibaiella koreensis TaxID=1268548 RepID=UPI0013C321F6|nr:T9SS type A sorting domain-containing protein [Taibaiella koreensis]
MSLSRIISLIAALLLTVSGKAAIQGDTCLTKNAPSMFTLVFPGAHNIQWSMYGGAYFQSVTNMASVWVFPYDNICATVLTVNYDDVNNVHLTERVVLHLKPYLLTYPNQLVEAGVQSVVSCYNPCPGNCTYQWSIPGCSNCIIGSSTSSTVNFYPPPISGNGSFTIQCFVDCGTACVPGNTLSMNLKTQLARPQVTASGQGFCASANPITYTTTPVPGATSYEWTLPAGWTGNSTTNTIVATPNGTYGGNVTVAAKAANVSSATAVVTAAQLSDTSRHNLIAMSDTRIVYVGTDQKLHSQHWDGTQWVYTAINPSGGWGNIQVEGWLAANDLGTRVFFKTTTGKLYFLIFLNNSWFISSVPTTTDVRSNILWRSDGIFYIGVDNKVYRGYQSGSFWNVAAIVPPGWPGIQIAGNLALDPATEGNIFFRTKDNRLFNIYDLTGGYSSPKLGEIITSGCSGEVIFRNNRVYFRATDYKIHYMQWNNGWVESVYAPNTAYDVNGFIAFDNMTDKIFYKGSDGKVRNVYPVSPGSSTYADGQLGNNLNVAGDLLYMGGKLFYIATDNKIHNFQWNGTNWWDSDFPLPNAKTCSRQYFSFSAKPAADPDDISPTNNGSDQHMVKEMREATGFSLYPNPSKGLFTIEMPDIKTAGITLYDAQGNKLVPVMSIGNDTRCTIDLSRYPKGLYMIHITTNGQRISRKVLFQ